MSTRPIKLHSHCWIDLTENPIDRAPYSPILGEGPRMMQPGKTYTCRECGAEVVAPAIDQPKRATFRATGE